MLHSPTAQLPEADSIVMSIAAGILPQSFRRSKPLQLLHSATSVHILQTGHRQSQADQLATSLLQGNSTIWLLS